MIDLYKIKNWDEIIHDEEKRYEIASQLFLDQFDYKKDICGLAEIYIRPLANDIKLLQYPVFTLEHIYYFAESAYDGFQSLLKRMDGIVFGVNENSKENNLTVIK